MMDRIIVVILKIFIGITAMSWVVLPLFIIAIEDKMTKIIRLLEEMKE